MINKEKNLNSDMFHPVNKDKIFDKKIVRPRIKYWPDFWRRLKKNKLAIFGLIIISIMIVFAYIGPVLNMYTYYEQDYALINLHPQKLETFSLDEFKSIHWFGTDELGRDLFTRTWYGVSYSLLIGGLSTFIVLILGLLYGGISGMASGIVDSLMMRIAEIIYSIPYLLIVILISVVFSNVGSGTSIFVLVLALSLTSWVPMAILVRGQVLKLKESDYVLASESLGASNIWILKKHIIPNAIGPILVSLTLCIPRVIFAEASLSFLGLGLQAPLASLGTLANEGLGGLAIGNSYQIFIPSLFLSLIMFSFNALGDGLRDALDPRFKN